MQYKELFLRRRLPIPQTLSRWFSDMADSTAPDNLKLKRAILKEVYIDNLEGSRKPRPAGRPRQASSQARGKTLWLVLALLPIIAVVYFFTQLAPPATLAAIAAPRAKATALPPAAPLREGQAAGRTFGISSLTTLAGLAGPGSGTVAPGPEPEENLPRNYQALLAPSPIPLAQLFGLDAKTIVIDPGHGGRDPGAIGPGGLQEKDVTLQVALLLRERLSAYPGYRILLTRDKDVRISTRQRVAFANDQKADLFISIHCNSLDKEQLNIIETYYFGAQADEESLRLAEAENQGSEYLMAEFKGMIKKIGDNFKQQESNALAASIQSTLYRRMKAQDEAVVNRGTKMAPFVVLLGADMPSVLAEITCISNPQEEKKLADPVYLETFAQHLEGGIVGYLNQTHSNATNANNGAKRNGEKRGTNGQG